ncbi:A24 family peptidase [Halalkalibacter sp. APA_J-10(15)]|uniref:prepilin peptidase n=1 Tax=Halalkalibacter sp. APA_J-10(15) TaxID=2933805 RepID=UPI001FF5ED74|nr:A24 family peptidase [Halalkalibacter sp. APA_J-10(15)]MCK0473540.1 prepilin peptidase [Halalkalibacter sp. APA_J-10(15)]
MNIVIMSYLILLGMVVGSFVNVVGLRVPKKESIISPRSHCPTCERPLIIVDLIPLFSFLFTKGRCRMCRQRISSLYPIIEGLTGFLFVLAYWNFHLTPEFFVALLFISLLMIVVVSDISYMIIPDHVLLFFFPLFIILRYTIAPLTSGWSPLLGGIIGFLLLWIIAIASRGGMGGGDVKLFGVIGMVLGWQQVLVAFFFSCLIGAIIGIIGMLVGKVKKGQPFPFGPFIVIGTILAYFYGSSLLELYINYFGLSVLALFV